MGVSQSISIGPYMIVKGEKKLEVDKQIFTCSNEECNVFIKNTIVTSKFCGTCGSAAKAKFYKEEKVVKAKDSFRNEEQFEDELCYTDQMCGRGEVFVPNEYSPFYKDRRNKEEEAVDLTDANPKEEIEWFEKKYEKIIEFIRKDFGQESVEIKWGVVQWWS